MPSITVRAVIPHYFVEAEALREIYAGFAAVIPKSVAFSIALSHSLNGLLNLRR